MEFLLIFKTGAELKTGKNIIVITELSFSRIALSSNCMNVKEIHF